MTVAVKWLLVANLTFGLDAVAWAQDSNSDFGKSLFVSACSNCHGIDGKGKGPLSDQLKVVPPDVRQFPDANAIEELLKAYIRRQWPCVIRAAISGAVTHT